MDGAKFEKTFFMKAKGLLFCYFFCFVFVFDVLKDFNRILKEKRKTKGGIR